MTSTGSWEISFDEDNDNAPVLTQVTPTPPVDPDKTEFILDELEVLAGAGHRGLGYEFTISDIDIDHGRPDTPFHHLRAINASNNTTDQSFTFIDKGNNKWELALKAGKELDYERYGDTLELEIVTSDTFAQSSNKLELTININNVNDEDPEFVNNPPITWLAGFENGFIPEGTPFGTTVARIEVTDADGLDLWPDRPYVLNAKDIANVGGVIIGFFQVLVEDDTGHGLLQVRGDLERESGDVINTFPDVFIRVDDDRPFHPLFPMLGRFKPTHSPSPLPMSMNLPPRSCSQTQR